MTVAAMSLSLSACALAARSLVRSRSSVRVAKVCAEGAFDLSGDPVGELEVEPGEFFGDGSGSAVCDETDEVVNVGADLVGMVAMRSSDHCNGLQCREGRKGRYRDDLVDDHIAVACGDDDAFWLCGCEGEAPGKRERTTLGVTRKRVVCEIHHIDLDHAVSDSDLDIAASHDRDDLISEELTDQFCLGTGDGVRVGCRSRDRSQPEEHSDTTDENPWLRCWEPAECFDSTGKHGAAFTGDDDRSVTRHAAPPLAGSVTTRRAFRDLVLGRRPDLGLRRPGSVPGTGC